MIRFDDGLANTYTNAMPILEKYGYPAMVAMITGNIGASNYLSASQLRGLVSRGWEIGSHTSGHIDCTTLTATQLDAELELSIAQLVAAGVPYPRTFVYPWGARNTTTDKEVYLRFTKAMSTVNHHAMPHPEWPTHLLPYGTLPITGATLADDVELLKRQVERQIARGNNTVIAFHSIVAGTPAPSSTELSVETFEAIIAWLAGMNVRCTLPYLTAPHNLIEDGGFERYPINPGGGGYTDSADILTPWRYSLAASKYARVVNPALARRGSVVIEFDSARNGAAAADHIRQYFPVVPGKVYRIRYWENVVSLSAGDIRCVMRPLNTFGAALTTTNAHITNAPTVGWVERNVTWTAPANACYAAFSWTNSTATGKAYLDDVAVFDNTAHDFLA